MKSINSMTLAEIKKAIRLEGKRANTRLRALEKNGLAETSPAYGEIEKFMFDKMEFIGKTYKGEVKFRTDTTDRSLQQLRKELKQIRKFLTAKTSTKIGIESVYKSAYESFIKNNAKKFAKRKPTFKEWAKVWQSQTMQTLGGMFGSEFIVRIASVQNILSDDELEKIVEMLNDEVDRTQTNPALFDFVDAYGNVVDKEEELTEEARKRRKKFVESIFNF